jgi:hypothetical protein
VLALRKREIVAERRARRATPGTPASPATEAPAAEAPDAATPRPTAAPESLDTREALAKAARLSSSQVVMIEKIQKQAAPSCAAVKAGTISINAAAAVASLPPRSRLRRRRRQGRAKQAAAGARM